MPDTFWSPGACRLGRQGASPGLEGLWQAVPKRLSSKGLPQGQLGGGSAAVGPAQAVLEHSWGVVMCEVAWFQIRGERQQRYKVVLPVSPGALSGDAQWAQHPRLTTPGPEQISGWVLLACSLSQVSRLPQGLSWCQPSWGHNPLKSKPFSP